MHIISHHTQDSSLISLFTGLHYCVLVILSRVLFVFNITWQHCCAHQRWPRTNAAYNMHVLKCTCAYACLCVCVSACITNLLCLCGPVFPKSVCMCVVYAILPCDVRPQGTPVDSACCLTGMLMRSLKPCIFSLLCWIKAAVDIKHVLHF